MWQDYLCILKSGYVYLSRRFTWVSTKKVLFCIHAHLTVLWPHQCVIHSWIISSNNIYLIIGEMQVFFITVLKNNLQSTRKLYRQLGIKSRNCSLLFISSVELHLSGHLLSGLPITSISMAFWINLSIIRQNKLPWNYLLSDRVQYGVIASRTSNQAWLKSVWGGIQKKQD
jgi:hypothetical protein